MSQHSEPSDIDDGNSTSERTSFASIDQTEDQASSSGSDVPPLPPAPSDEDSDSEDSDDESDNEAKRLHDESVKAQTSRVKTYFGRAAFSPDIFPPRTAQKQWKGGRVKKKRQVGKRSAHIQRELFPNEDDAGNEEGNSDGEGGDADGEDDSYQPHHRHKKIPVNKRRGRNRPYSTLSSETKREWLKDAEKFMRNDANWKLDLARKVFR